MITKEKKVRTTEYIESTDSINTIDPPGREKNKELEKLIYILDNAAKTYRKVSSAKVNENIEYFIKTLEQQHKVFVRKVIGRKTDGRNLIVKNQLEPGATFNRDSAIDLLLLCIEIEKQILDYTRQAVHNTQGKEKQMLCKQLTFSEQAIFDADQMLEEYE